MGCATSKIEEPASKPAKPVAAPVSPAKPTHSRAQVQEHLKGYELSNQVTRTQLPDSEGNTATLGPPPGEQRGHSYSIAPDEHYPTTPPGQAPVAQAPQGQNPPAQAPPMQVPPGQAPLGQNSPRLIPGEVPPSQGVPIIMSEEQLDPRSDRQKRRQERRKHRNGGHGHSPYNVVGQAYAFGTAAVAMGGGGNN